MTNDPLTPARLAGLCRQWLRWWEKYSETFQDCDLADVMYAFPALARAALGKFLLGDGETLEAYESVKELVARCEAAQEGAEK